MPPKPEAGDKAVVLKGAAAEEAVRQYIKKCNRPYGAADVSANIKKVGSKLATQKILLVLTEKGEITQKSYGKQTFFVTKQSDEDDMPTEKADALQKEVDECKEKIKELTSSNRLLANESTRIRLGPTTDSLPALISTLRSSLEDLEGVLAPYRISFADAPIPEAKDVERLDADWSRWREEWKKRKKIFKEIWSSITEHLSPPGAFELAESLGIEFDSDEHDALERGPLCQPPARHRAGATGKTTKH